MTMNLTTPQAAQLGEAWGAALERVLWDAILDYVEAGLRATDGPPPVKPGALVLQGFSCIATPDPKDPTPRPIIRVALLKGGN